jgi:glucosyl-dolichyl phosphate glucuronosyltransferase
VMTLSVIVATKNRAADLERMLPTLASQTHLPEELIIVDQSCGEETRRIVESFARDLKRADHRKPETVYVYDATPVGAGGARNVGIECSHGEILVFLDDDVLLEPEFMYELLRVYQGYPDAGGVSGVVTNYALPPRSARILRRLFWTGPFHDERQPLYWGADRLRDHQPVQVRRFGSNVMSIRRELLADERFDPFYRGAGAEDVDLTWRIHERCRLLIAPRARLFHVRSEAGREAAHWIRQDAFSTYYLYHRLWRGRIVNRLCFAWLRFGYALLASAGSARRLSLRPWQSLLQGRRSALECAYDGMSHSSTRTTPT